MNKFVSVIVAAALSFGTIITPAHANPLWGNVGPWEIRIDTVDNGCFALASYERGTIIRLGVDVTRQQVDIYYVNADLKNRVKVGKTYTLRFGFDYQSTSMEGAMDAIQMNKTIALYNGNVSLEFIKSFAYRNTMQIYAAIDGIWTKIDNVTLAGTNAALTAVSQCQSEMKASRQTPNVSERNQRYYQ